MKYCKKCRELSDSGVCDTCGNDKLIDVSPTDFCFIAEYESTYGEMIKGIFSGENIPFSAVPYGTGARSGFGLRLENLRFYVPYEYYGAAKDILSGFSFPTVE